MSEYSTILRLTALQTKTFLSLLYVKDRVNNRLLKATSMTVLFCSLYVGYVVI